MKREVEIGDYKLVPYTNKSGETKSFFVMGNTYDIKEELRQLGGTWASFVRNPYTNTLGVWIFSLTRLKDVENWLRGTPTRSPNSNVSKSVSKRRRNKSYIDETILIKLQDLSLFKGLSQNVIRNIALVCTVKKIKRGKFLPRFLRV